MRERDFWSMWRCMQHNEIIVFTLKKFQNEIYVNVLFHVKHALPRHKLFHVKHLNFLSSENQPCSQYAANDHRQADPQSSPVVRRITCPQQAGVHD